MKNIKYVICALGLLFTTAIIAQNEPVDIKKTIVDKTFNITKNDTKIPYNIKVYNTTKSLVKLKKEDKNKINQDRAEVPKYVSKFIYVDNSVDNTYDKYIVMRYWKDADDSFELKPTDNGFKVVVDGKYVEYIFGEGAYTVNKTDNDFFMIDQFDPIVML